MTATDKISKDELNLFDKKIDHIPYFSNIPRQKHITSSERVILECVWTDKLQSELDYANACIFKNFQLRLVME
jgi:hypothetical protein